MPKDNQKSGYDSIDSIITENALLHQRIALQKTIQANLAKEALAINEMNMSLRRIIACVLFQNGQEYRISYKTLMQIKDADRIEMEVDQVSNDWILKFTKGE